MEPQAYFKWNLTTFDESGIHIKLNFSDPMMLSQSLDEDEVHIKLKKSFFLMAGMGSRFLPGRLLVSTYEETDEFFILKESIPRQDADSEEAAKVGATAAAAKQVLAAGFSMSFAVSILLNGVMNQLWNIFNTLQIIMALPLLPVIVPTNVLTIQEAIIGITNVQVVPKDEINSSVVEPVFGKDEKESGESSLMVQLFQSVAIVIIVLLLIALILYCRRKVLPKCPMALQNLVKTIEGKLMYNSILRSLMQMFLSNSLTTWTTIRAFNIVDSRAKVEISVAFLTLAFLTAMPIWSYKFLRKHAHEVNTDAFKKKYDSLFQNVDLHKLKALSYTTYFLGRRLLFAFVIVCCQPYLVLQIALIDMLSTF